MDIRVAGDSFRLPRILESFITRNVLVMMDFDLIRKGREVLGMGI